MKIAFKSFAILALSFTCSYASAQRITLTDNWYCVKYQNLFKKDSITVFSNNLVDSYVGVDSCEGVCFIIKKKVTVEKTILCGDPEISATILTGKFKKNILLSSKEAAVYTIVCTDNSRQRHQWQATVTYAGKGICVGSVNGRLRLALKKLK
jgi:hypothetical protein